MGIGLTRRGALVAGAALGLVPNAARAQADAVERWGVFEAVLTGRIEHDPFGVALTGVFTDGRTTARVPGFHDGDGTWRIRFSPPETGAWRWRTESPVAALDGREGAFEVTSPGPGNHGPVSVVDDYHFAHADGTPFRQIGTTSYGWSHQPEAMRHRTLETLKGAPFNKIRMLVPPNAAVRTNAGPQPFVRTGPGPRDWDPMRPDPAFFQRLDACVAALCDIGVQADLILFHPYDQASGLHAMPAEWDERYLRYVVARYSAYRNVWWSLANEFDILKKSEEDWDRLFQVVRDADPHGRLRSIHNWRRLYDNGKPWVTHSSIQNGSAVLDDARAETYRSVWKKAVVFDEVCYEGNLDQRWGNLTGPEMVRAFWHGLVGGTYVGHSECLPTQAGGGFWLGEGGELRGESAPRLAFLKSIMEAGPRPGIDPIDKWWEQHLGGAPGQYYLRYFGAAVPTEWAVELPKDALEGGERFHLDVIDTWNMTIERQTEVWTMRPKTGDRYYFNDPDRRTLALPGRPWMAVRLTRA